MLVVYKYPLMTGPLQLPASAVVLSVQLQDGRPILWALVDTTDRAFSQFKITMLLTGEQIHGSSPEEFLSSNRHLATLQRQDGLVFHVFLGLA